MQMRGAYRGAYQHTSVGIDMRFPRHMLCIWMPAFSMCAQEVTALQAAAQTSTEQALAWEEEAKHQTVGPRPRREEITRFRSFSAVVK